MTGSTSRTPPPPAPSPRLDLRGPKCPPRHRRSSPKLLAPTPASSLDPVTDLLPESSPNYFSNKKKIRSSSMDKTIPQSRITYSSCPRRSPWTAPLESGRRKSGCNVEPTDRGTHRKYVRALCVYIHGYVRTNKNGGLWPCMKRSRPHVASCSGTTPGLVFQATQPITLKQTQVMEIQKKKSRGNGAKIRRRRRRRRRQTQAKRNPHPLGPYPSSSSVQQTIVHLCARLYLRLVYYYC